MRKAGWPTPNVPNGGRLGNGEMFRKDGSKRQPHSCLFLHAFCFTCDDVLQLAIVPSEQVWRQQNSSGKTDFLEGSSELLNSGRSR